MNSSRNAEYIAHYLEYAATGIISIAGLTAQSFIIAINVSDRLKGGLMSAVDQIIFSLGLSRFFFHFFSLWSFFQIVFTDAEAEIFDRIILIDLIYMIGDISVISSIWLSSLLSVILCLKISNFHNLLFLHLKAIISKRTIPLIILIVLCSCTLTFLYSSIQFIEYPNNSTSAKIIKESANSEILNSLLILWLVLALFIYFLSTFFLIIPLCLHINKMKSDTNMTFCMDTYTKTIIFIILSFLMCAAYIIFTLKVENVNLHNVKTILIWNIFPFLHSAYLIYAITKLRNHFVKTFQPIKSLFHQ
uniref:Taste receptor type 2 n=1 Tax=Pyxicephalus adspersus TaxID=30357 RepID=A0AAV3AS75_PYXAD|nr:TPA: hypothetical protein GDO54_009901 [Pyxicephalus adspersus]